MSSTVDLKAFKKLAKKNEKKYVSFLKGLYYRKERKQIDKLALQLNKEAFKKIDCLDCANCCKTMTPTYTEKDLKRIAKHVGMTRDEYFDKYCYKDENKDIVHKKTPCHFLNDDNKCAIYEIRPVDCSGFPHLANTNPGFVGSFTANRDFVSRCPIAYDVIDTIYKKIKPE